MIKTSLLFLVGVMVVSVADAQYLYKWTDAKGNVHYSDYPNVSKTKKVTIKNGYAKSAINAPAKCPYAK
jgi:hypothetical protein